MSKEMDEMISGLQDSMLDKLKQYTSPQTNSERIRQLSDEELADMLIQWDDINEEFICPDETRFNYRSCYGSQYELAIAHTVKWLNEDVTEKTEVINFEV